MQSVANRLLILAPRPNGRGAERQLVLVATGLMNRGWDVHVLTMASRRTVLVRARGIRTHKTAQPGPPRSLGFLHHIGVRCDMSGDTMSAVVQGWMQPCNDFCGAVRLDDAAQCRPRGQDNIARSVWCRSQGLPAIGAHAGQVGPGNGDAAIRKPAWGSGRIRGMPAGRLHHIPNGLPLPQRDVGAALLGTGTVAHRHAGACGPRQRS